MAYAPSDAMLAAAGALLACALLVCLEPARPATALRAVLTRALILGLAAPFIALGVILASALHDGVGLVVCSTLVATIMIAIAVRDLVLLARVRRDARSARAAKTPTAPLGDDVRGVDFGVGDELVALEKAADDPYRAVPRARHFFHGSAPRAIGAMRRAWVLEALAALTIGGVAMIVSRPRPTPSTLTQTRSPAPPPRESHFVAIWSTRHAGDARLLGNDPRHVNIELSNIAPATWSLDTLDVAQRTQTASWSASSSNAALWTGVHTRAGFHGVDQDLEHDLARYASLVLHDWRVATSSESIVFAKRDEEDAPTRLFIAKRDGSAPRRLDETHTGSDSPELSRDGKRLAWVAWTERVASEGYHVVSAKADGSAQRIVPGSVGAFGWRADGHLIGHVKEHERECIIDTDDPLGLRHCIRDGRLGSLVWDARGESVAWLGFVASTLAYEWIRLATGEVLAHGAVTGAISFADALLDSEQLALFVTSGRDGSTTFATDRIDLRTGMVTTVVASWLPAASGRGVMAWGEDRSILLLERDVTPEPRVWLLRVWP